MTSKFIYYLLLLIIGTGCQKAKQDLGHNANANGYMELVKLINSVPVAEEPLYFDSPEKENDSIKFIAIPDTLITKLTSDSVLLSKSNPMSDHKSMKQTRDEGLRYSTDTVRFRFYKRLSLDTGHFYLLTALKKNNIESDWWQIQSFTKQGKQIATIEGIHGLYLAQKTLVTWWWFASNAEPDFMVWGINSEGQFNMISQKQEVPQQIKGVIDRFGKAIRK
jgi:hypothetical protein